MAARDFLHGYKRVFFMAACVFVVGYSFSLLGKFILFMYLEIKMAKKVTSYI